MRNLLRWFRETDNELAMIAGVLLGVVSFVVWGVLVAVAALNRNVPMTLLLLFGGPMGLLYLAYWYDNMDKK